MSEEEIICSIDLEFSSEAEEDDWFVLTSCGHAFHNSCIRAWIGSRIDRSCPVCNQKVRVTELQRIHGINPSKQRPIVGGAGEGGALSGREPYYSFDIILLGRSGVGKTSLIQRYTDGTLKYNLTATIGFSGAFKRLQIGEKLIKLTLWDTCGTEKFRALSGSFARRAHGVLLVYSYADMDSSSLGDITYWIDFVKKYGVHAADAAMILVGNKNDIAPENRGITSKQGHDFAKKNALPLFETSSLDGLNVTAVFEALVTDVLGKVENKQIKYVSDGEKKEEGVIKVVLTNVIERVESNRMKCMKCVKEERVGSIRAGLTRLNRGKQFNCC